MFFYITDKHLFMLINVGIRTGRDHINFSISCSSGLAVLASPGRIRLLFQCAKLVTPNLFLRNILATMTSLKVLIALAAIVGIASPLDIFQYYGLSAYSIFNDIQSAWTVCPNSSRTKYHEALTETNDCIEQIAKNQSVCRNLKDKVLKCSIPVVDYFLDCLPEKSKDLPPAFAKAIVSLINAFCTSSGELLLEASNPCIYDYNSERNITVKESCKIKNLQEKYGKLQTELPSKLEACEAFEEIAGCWKAFVQENCSSLKTREFFSKFYDAASAACK